MNGQIDHLHPFPQPVCNVSIPSSYFLYGSHNSALVPRVFPLTAKEPDKPITVVYVPSHLYHMVFELFKVAVSCSHFLRPHPGPLTPATGTL